MLKASLLLTGLLLLGCADVRPPAASPDGVSTSTQAEGQSGGDLSADQHQADGSVPVGFEQDGAEPETPESEVEDGGEEGDEGDEGDEGHEGEASGEHPEPDEDAFLACLDRGPGSPPHCPQFKWKSPLEGLTQEEIREKVKTELASIGPISVGAPNRGRLFNGVQMPKSDLWKQNDPGNAWGTQETVDSIVRAIEKVNKEHAGTQPVIIGHISAKAGGRLKPHKSHQAGRDVDLSYFYKETTGWYAVANEKNLDQARTWTFVKAFLEDPNTEMILIDTSLQRLLMAYALQKGEDKAFIDKVFQVSGKSQSPLIRHAKGHATHIHVRFFSPAAQASSRLAAAFLPKPPPPPVRKPGKTPGKPGKPGKDEPNVAKGGKGHKGGDEASFLYHRARNGDTLDALSRKYAVSVMAIKQANGLKSNDLKINKTYRIPKATR